MKKKGQKQIEIYDTTLRDGVQGMFVNYVTRDKLEIAEQLDALHVDYIEGGFPLSNEKEAEFFVQAKKLKLKHAKIVAFGSTAKNYEHAENDIQITALLGAETSVVTIVGKASAAHVREVLRTTLEKNLKMIYASVAALVKHDREVILDLEHFFDGYKLNPSYTEKILMAGSEAGASRLILCDTNGGTLPHEVETIMNSLPTKNIASIGGHFHDDCGVGVANSLVAVHCGATQLQGTINGWGERVGNANLCEIIPNIVLKDPRYTAHCAPYVSKMTSLSRYVAEKANIIPEPRQPFVGNVAFSHKAGQHADVIVKNPTLIEHIKAETVGNKRRILLSELAGKSTIVEKLKKFGNFSKSDDVVSSLTKTLKQKETEGYEYEAAEASFEIEMLKSLKKICSTHTIEKLS